MLAFGTFLPPSLLCLWHHPESTWDPRPVGYFVHALACGVWRDRPRAQLAADLICMGKAHLGAHSDVLGRARAFASPVHGGGYQRVHVVIFRHASPATLD